MSEGDGAAGAATRRDHFAKLVARWEHFGPPLRPWPSDTALVQEQIDARGHALRALVLGLTPETIGCAWPAGSALVAVDHSAEMIAALWPEVRKPHGARVVQADWTAMPEPDASIDLAAGDGVLVLLGGPEGALRVVREVARVLAPDGTFVVRSFLRRAEPEPVDAIAAELSEGRVASVHALKLRLLAALHGASGPGTRLGDVWDAWATMRRAPSPPGAPRGWSAEEIVGIESYRGLETRYHLGTEDEVVALLCEGGFARVEVRAGGNFVARKR